MSYENTKTENEAGGGIQGCSDTDKDKKDIRASKDKGKRKGGGAFFFIIRNVILPVFIVSVLARTVFVNAYVPSGSMENTIMTGDCLIGSRLDKSYDRGDIIIFRSPQDPRICLIKRIIGLPGENIKIRQAADGYARVLVNGAVIAEPYVKEPMEFEEGFDLDIGDDEYFVLGDNRNNSYDARYWPVHTIKSDSILGVAKFSYWPFSNAKFLS